MQSRRHRACPAVTVASTLRLTSLATRTGSRSRRRSASRSSVECSYLRGIRYREVLHQMHRRRVVSLIPRLSLSADVRSTRSHPAAELERELITEGTRAPPRLRPRAWTRRRAQAQDDGSETAARHGEHGQASDERRRALRRTGDHAAEPKSDRGLESQRGAYQATASTDAILARSASLTRTASCVRWSV
jgi:hypothetical protein